MNSRRVSKASKARSKKELDDLLSKMHASDQDSEERIRGGKQELWNPGSLPIGAGAVEHPSHYTSHPSGIECIEITEHFNFNIGNAMKYLWRSGLKNPDPKEDLEKALWYVKRELERIAKERP